MNVAVCYYAAKEIEQTLAVYNEILNKFPNYSYVKVNLRLFLSGNLHKALLFLESYIESVGGMYGNSKLRDNNAIEKWTTVCFQFTISV